MADPRNAPQLLGTTSGLPSSGSEPNLLGAVTNPKAMDDESKFGDWFQSEQGQVMMGTLMNAVGSIGAGMAGMPAGGSDMSSLGRGAAAASQAHVYAQQQYDSKTFRRFIDGKLETEMAKPEDKQDQDKIMTLQMMRRDPEGYIKASQSGENWFERMQAAYEFGKKKKGDDYAAGNKLATDHFNSVLTPEQRQELKNGNLDTLTGLALMKPELVAFWLGDGGSLDGVNFGIGKPDDPGFWSGLWKKVFGEDEKPAAVAPETGGQSVGAYEPSQTDPLAPTPYVPTETTSGGRAAEAVGRFGGQVAESFVGDVRAMRGTGGQTGGQFQVPPRAKKWVGDFLRYWK